MRVLDRSAEHCSNAQLPTSSVGGPNRTRRALGSLFNGKREVLPRAHASALERKFGDSGCCARKMPLQFVAGFPDQPVCSRERF